MTTPYWQTADFSPAPCLPCCTPPTPGECSCALLQPPPWTAFLFPNYAAAAAAIPVIVYNCNTIYGYLQADLPGTFVSAFDGTTFTASGSANASFEAAEHLGVTIEIAVSMKSGDVLSLAFTNTGDGDTSETTANLIDCADGSVLDTDTSSSGSGTLTLTAPADGIYYVTMNGTQDFGGTNFPENADLTWTVTSSAVWVLLPAIMRWDDSGTTRSLWACPKLLLPPLTEFTGDWYASCADAHDVLTSVLVSGCVGFDDVGDISFLASFSFSATGGSSITFAHSAVGDFFSGPPGTFKPMQAWGGLNAVSGDVITVIWSASGTAGTGQLATAYLYDDTGTLLETVSNNTGANLVFSALPYTGRYTIHISASVEMISNLWGSLTAAATVSSSGTMTTNDIQARYDLGLDCASTLNCGDACP